MAKKVELYQLTPDKNVLMQCHLIRTKNDKIIVIDGGYYGKEYCYYIHSSIRSILGLKENDYFEIEGWFLTHPHEDHFGEMALQFENYSKDSNFKVNNFYFDFADFDEKHYQDMSDEMKDFMEKFKCSLDNYARVNDIKVNKRFYDDINGAVINSESVKNDLTISIDGVDFEILRTRDERDVIVNGSSMVMKMTVKDGEETQSVLFLGDLDKISGEFFLNETPKEKLKSDIVQMAHHGNWAVDKNVYDAIGAKVHLYPTPLWVWNCNNSRFDIDKVREWVGTTGADKYNLISCLYSEYPENRESVSDWAKVLKYMKIDLPYNID